MHSIFLNTSDLFSRALEVFNEMEMEINAIDKNIFRKLYLKIEKEKEKNKFQVISFSSKKANYMKE